MPSYEQMMEACESFLKAGRLRDSVSSLDTARKLCSDSYVKQIRPLSVDLRRAVRPILKDVNLSGENRAEYMDILKQTYRICAKESLDDFCVFTEWNRPAKDKFYLPRRQCLKPVVEQLQRMGEGGLDILGISLPPGVGKTTIASFYLDWKAGREPNGAMLIGSHSSAILKGMYKETLRHLDPEGEYLWNDAFPGLGICEPDAENMLINVGKAKRFANYQYASVGSNLAGKVRAKTQLYVDDLVGSSEEAQNPAQMDKLWQAFKTDYYQRMMDGCPILLVMTRWVLNDPMGRLMAQNENNDRAKFIAIPALDENDNSNFDFGKEYGGFSTAWLRQKREDLGESDFGALYQQEPVDKKGVLYKKEELNRFITLPRETADGIIAVCDTTNGKGDSSSMPIGYIFGDDYYFPDVVFSNALPEVTDELLAQGLVRNNVDMCQFESNNAGERIGKTVQKRVEELKGKTHIRFRHTQENKETKIIVNSDWVKKHCYFLADEKIIKGSMYDKFMKELCSYSLVGKNKHDDAADSIASFAIFAQGAFAPRARVLERSKYGF